MEDVICVFRRGCWCRRVDRLEGKRRGKDVFRRGLGGWWHRESGLDGRFCLWWRRRGTRFLLVDCYDMIV